LLTTDQRLRWAIQITNALGFIYSVGVIHGDLTCQNVFLDAQLNAKVGDFSGSSLDASPLFVTVAASHAYPREKLSIKADIFSLGSVSVRDHR
jgi:serine/threonine protein kinase